MDKHSFCTTRYFPFHYQVKFQTLPPSLPPFPQARWSLLPPPACHWLSQEYPAVLLSSICCLLLQQASTHPFPSCLHQKLLHGSSPTHSVPVCLTCGVRRGADGSLHYLWTIQVGARGRNTIHVDGNNNSQTIYMNCFSLS